MGIREMPDTFGLQEYYVTDIMTEVTGSDVRVVCGVRRGGTVYWLYSVVMPADRLIKAAQECSSAALDAFKLSQTEGAARH